MPVPQKRCDVCGKKMTYDPLLSKKRSKTKINSFWCTTVTCDYILVSETFYVKDKVQSVRNYVFHSVIPKIAET
ncbi:MAG: hypothetical protein HOD60_08855 [Candidatus Nitrosopelagicus sp.]|jgi:hypothetical protein|nr:hypothetical protein [Candidatus Nitrosopelagicus sp.]